MTAPDEAITNNLDRHFQRQVQRCATQLRQAADEMERHGSIRANIVDGLPDYSAAAVEILRDAQRLMSGLPLESLLISATETDRYIRSPGNAS